MSILSTENVVTTFNSLSNNYHSGGVWKMEVPQSSVQIAKPLTYKFRVAEYINSEDKVLKVGLQVQVWEHNSYGIGMLKQDWEEVERVKLQLTT